MGTGPNTIRMTLVILMSQPPNYTQELNINAKGSEFYICHLAYRNSKQILLCWISEHLNTISLQTVLFDFDASALCSHESQGHLIQWK